MTLNIFQWRSLKTRLTLFTLAIFLAGIWSLGFYASRVLRVDMQQVFGDQQFSTASFIAAQVNQELEDRLHALETVAGSITPALMSNRSALQSYLEQRPVFQSAFNGGIFAAGIDGTAIADIPLSAGRIGTNYLDRSSVSIPLKEGKSMIGRPAMGKKLLAPIFSMSAPIRNDQGLVIGVLVGTINLGIPSFLDKVTKNHYGESGSYLLVAPQHKLFVTASDSSRIMQPLPAPGLNPMHDKYMQGYEGHGVATSSRGVEELSAAKGIPVAGWYVVVVLPTAEAFAPIRTMQQHILLATIILTLLAGVLIWWIASRMLNSQLSPLLAASRKLDCMANEDQPQLPLPLLLPVTREDEIGELICGFNRLLLRLGKREEQLKLAASVFTHAGEGILIADPDGTIMEVNDAFCAITGYQRDEVLGQNPRLLSSGRHDKEFFTGLWCALSEKSQWNGEIWNRRKNGEVYAEMLSISVVRDTQGQTRHYVGMFTDITALKAHQSQLEHLAHYDVLTGLPNRVLLADRLQQAMVQAQRRGQRLAVAYLDLDGFKAINDQHGHQVGDQLLITLANRMKEGLREGDTLARLGGDEFVAVLLDLADVASCLPLLNRLLTAASQAVAVGDTQLKVSASLGVTFYPQAEEADADKLLRQSDQTMYQAKLAGKNRFQVFDAEQDRSVRGHHESLENIRRALSAREFVLYYQPKVNMRNGKLIGAEALIRWQHPESGLLAPAEFLPVIENHPLAVELGEWVIDSALTQMELWRAAGLDIPVSVNVGAFQLQQADFVERLRALLAGHPRIRPGDLEVEVLETSALEDMARVAQVIEACRKIGVMFALDDFGTGYSSLTYLKRLSVHQLKIDQSFVRDMLDDPDDLAILEGVLGLATAFDRQVIAEGVETVEHGEMLLQLGCELAQGYGIGRPMPAHELPGWVTDWQPDPAWVDLHSVSRDDLALLFASADHRAWMVAIEAYLSGEREAPPSLDHQQCRFGSWLEAEGLARYGAQPAFRVIGQLHRQAHVLAMELCELHAAGPNPEARARLGELQSLQDNFLEQLRHWCRKYGSRGRTLGAGSVDHVLPWPTTALWRRRKDGQRRPANTLHSHADHEKEQEMKTSQGFRQS